MWHEKKMCLSVSAYIIIYIHIDILYIHSKVTMNVYIYIYNYIWIIGACYCEAFLLPLHNRLLITCLEGRNLGAASCFGPWYLACQSLEWCNTSARCSFPRSKKGGDIGDSSYQETDVMYLGFCLGSSYLCFLRMRIQNLRNVEDSESHSRNISNYFRSLRPRNVCPELREPKGTLPFWSSFMTLHQAHCWRHHM